MSDHIKFVDGIAFLMDPDEVDEFEANRGAAPPPQQFADISDRQFYQALAEAPYAIISMAEAKLAVKIGQLPPAIQAVIDAIVDPVERDRADMLLSGATVFQRGHPEVSRFAGAMGWDDEQVNAFWAFAGAL